MTPNDGQSVLDRGYAQGHYGTQYAVTYDNPVKSIDYHLKQLSRRRGNRANPDIDFLLALRSDPTIRLQQAICESARRARGHVIWERLKRLAAGGSIDA